MLGQRGEAVSSTSVAFPRLCTPPAQHAALHATWFWPRAVKSPLSFSPPRAFKNEHNRSHGARRVQQAQRERKVPRRGVQARANLPQQPRSGGWAQPVDKGNDWLRTTELAPGGGLETWAQPSRSSPPPGHGWRQGLGPAAEECGSFPLRPPSWHRVPAQDAAYIMQLMKAK